MRSALIRPNIWVSFPAPLLFLRAVMHRVSAKKSSTCRGRAIRANSVECDQPLETAAAMPQRDIFLPAGRLIKDHRRARAGPSRRHPWRALRRRSRVVRRASPSGSPTSRPARRRAHRPNAARSKACSPGGMRRGSGFVPTPSGFTYMAMWLSADNHCLVRGVCSPAFALSCPRTTKAETASGLSVCKFVTNRVLL